MQNSISEGRFKNVSEVIRAGLGLLDEEESKVVYLKKPDLGKNYNGISNQLLGIKSNRHIIFYRTLNENYIEITRILHERMD